MVASEVKRKMPTYVNPAELEERIGDSGVSLMKKKYLPRDDKGDLTQTCAERFFTVASSVASVERTVYGKSEAVAARIERQFYEFMANLDFLPGGRVLANAGTEVKALPNCYVLPVPDDLKSIYGVVQEAAMIHKNGGGTGYNFSQLRPRGFKVKNGVASGPVSFAGQFDKETEVINSGNRRGANMGILNIDHPDILEFIRAKFQEGKLTNFNVSVGVTDEFMEAYKSGGFYLLKFNGQSFSAGDLEKICGNIEKAKAGADVGRKPIPPSLIIRGKEVCNIYPETDKRGFVVYSKTGEIITKEEVIGKVGENGEIYLDAKKVMGTIAKYAHASGEPGVIFLDTVERDNLLKSAGKLDTTNPCGEQPLHPYDACNLGSINLANMLIAMKTPTKESYVVDYKKLEDTVRLAVRFLDDVIDLSEGPIPKVQETMRKHRRMGLGVMGWADMLMRLNVPYDSEAGLKLAEELMGKINDVAMEESKKLARERGVFPAFKDSDYAHKKPKAKVRNLARTTIAPTGSISMVAGVSGGIEPQYALVYHKKMRGGDVAEVLSPPFEDAIKAAGLDVDKIVDKVKRNKGSCQGIEEIPKSIRDVFRTAHDVSPEYHIRMQAAFQTRTDNAISKTINLSNSATVEDVLNAYVLAHSLKCKGITVYRDGSRDIQVLNTSSVEESDINYNNLFPRKRLPEMAATVYTIKSGCGKLFVTISHDSSGRLADLFANPHGKEGGCTSNLNALTIMASKAMRAGVALEEIVDALSSHVCPAFMSQKAKLKGEGNGNQIAEGSSCPSAIANLIQRELGKLSQQFPETYRDYLERQKEKQEKKAGGKKTEASMKCPDCGLDLHREEGCLRCTCGFSRC